MQLFSGMKLELVGHALCPYVHRTAILLEEKGIAHTRRFVDLEEKPDWFLEMSPRGKVPLLVVDDHDVLFESNVIDEFLDETNPPCLLPRDPLARARERGWIEAANDLFDAEWQYAHAIDEAGHAQGRDALESIVDRLEDEIVGPYFHGDLGLVDIAFAPALHRLAIIERWRGVQPFAGHPRVDDWARLVASRESVKKAASPGFEEHFVKVLAARGAWLARLVA